MFASAFVGATCYEAFVWRFWVTLLRPAYWRSADWRSFVRVGFNTDV